MSLKKIVVLTCLMSVILLRGLDMTFSCKDATDPIPAIPNSLKHIRCRDANRANKLDQETHYKLYDPDDKEVYARLYGFENTAEENAQRSVFATVTNAMVINNNKYKSYGTAQYDKQGYTYLFCLQGDIAYESLTGFVDQKADKKLGSSRAVMMIGLAVAQWMKAAKASNMVFKSLNYDNIEVMKDDVAKPRTLDMMVASGSTQTYTNSDSFTDPRIGVSKSLQIDYAASVWEFGTILYKLYTGAFPFKPASGSTLWDIKKAGVVNFPFKPERSVAALILKCLKADTAQRITIDNLVSEITTYLSSDNDVIVKNTEFKANDNLNPTVWEVESTTANPTEKQQYQTRFGRIRRVLTDSPAKSQQVSSGSSEESEQLVVLVCVGSALLMFLVFWSIAAWVDRLRRSDILAESLDRNGSNTIGQCLDSGLGIAREGMA